MYHTLKVGSRYISDLYGESHAYKLFVHPEVRYYLIASQLSYHRQHSIRRYTIYEC